MAYDELSKPTSTVYVSEDSSSKNTVGPRDDFSFFDCHHIDGVLAYKDINDTLVVAIDGCTLPEKLGDVPHWPNTTIGLADLALYLESGEYGEI